MVTFITRAEAHQTCSGEQCGLLATNTDGSIKTGAITIHSGLRLLLTGHMTVASLVTIQGTFTFTFSATRS
jgi:hypothetical protein